MARITIASDHAGYRLKEALIAHLIGAGHDIDDLGTHSEEPVDYPPICAAAGRAVVAGRADFAIVDEVLSTDYEGGRHDRRVALIADIENEEAAN